MIIKNTSRFQHPDRPTTTKRIKGISDGVGVFKIEIESE